MDPCTTFLWYHDVFALLCSDIRKDEKKKNVLHPYKISLAKRLLYRTKHDTPFVTCVHTRQYTSHGTYCLLLAWCEHVPPLMRSKRSTICPRLRIPQESGKNWSGSFISLLLNGKSKGSDRPHRGLSVPAAQAVILHKKSHTSQSPK